MIKIENVEVMGWEAAIRGMRNPYNSWQKSDSFFMCESGPCDKCKRNGGCSYWGKEYSVGPNDHDLIMRLRNAGTDHRKFMRMITVYLDITAPLYFFKEFDTYKVGTVANSCSTMHKIADKEFTLEDFSYDHLFGWNVPGSYSPSQDCFPVEESDGEERLWASADVLETIIDALNFYRDRFLKTKDKKYWWQMIQLLPSSYNQRRTVMLNYEVLANIYKSRKNHKLDEWVEFCKRIEQLPYSELITGIDMNVVDKLNAVGNPNPVFPDELKHVIDKKGE